MNQPIIRPLQDDEAQAKAVLEDAFKFCRHFRIALIPRLEPGLCIAISEPMAGKFMPGWAHSRQQLPARRDLVTCWVDRCRTTMLPAEGDLKLVKDQEIFEAFRKCLTHYHSCLIPMPVEGQPMMILCEDLGTGQNRAYAVVKELDLYGYTDRPVKPRVTQ
jgi:hypothetical protein